MLVILVGAWWLISGRTASNQSNSTNSTSPTQSTSTTPTAAGQSVTYSNAGFLPSSVTIMSGQTVTFTNSSSSLLQINSDPHPTHTDNPELNIGAINPGESKTVTLTTKGTWGYHNHLNSSQRGSVIVQ